MQAKISVTTGTSGLVVSKPLLYVLTHLRVSNGIAQVLPSQPFWHCVSYFSKDPIYSPINMVVATASRSPLEIRKIPEKIVCEFPRCLYIGADKVKATGGTQGGETEEGNIPTIPTVE